MLANHPARDGRSQLWTAVTLYAASAGAMALVEAVLTAASPSVGCRAFGQSLLAGALAGAFLGSVVAWLGRGARLRRAVVIVASLGVGVWLCSYMGILDALSGGAPRLAALSLVLTVCAACGFAGLLIGVARGPTVSGWLHEVGPSIRAALCTVLGSAAGVTAHWWVPSYYVAVQHVAIWAAMLLFGLLLQVSARVVVPPAVAITIAGVGGLLAVAVPVVEARGEEPRAALGNIIMARAAAQLSRRVTDADGDGYSSWLGEGDCAPWNGRVHPNAREVPNNGVDDNCIWGDAPDRVRSQPAEALPSAPSPLSVVLITLDTVRWDRVGLSGLRPSPTPYLDAWAHDAMIYERAYAASTRTCSSLASLHYGSFPRSLRWATVADSDAVRRLRGRLPNARLRPNWMCITDEAGPEGRQPLAERLRRRGMATAAVVNDFGTHLLQREFFGEGFQTYRDAPVGDDEGVVQASIEMLDALQRGARPFFLWVHLFGPHERGASQRFRDTLAEYDAALRQTDAVLLPLLQAIDAAASHAPLAVIVLSDHGELMSSNKRWHGSDLSDELLRIPLLIRAPGARNGRQVVLASSIDVVPTVLALTRTPPSPELVGIDLVLGTERDTPLFSDTWLLGLGISLSAAYDGRSKVVYSHSARTYETLSQLPAIALRRGDASALRQALDGYLRDNELNFIGHLAPPQ